MLMLQTWAAMRQEVVNQGINYYGYIISITAQLYLNHMSPQDQSLLAESLRCMAISISKHSWSTGQCFDLVSFRGRRLS